jgi:hypothetical protein
VGVKLLGLLRQGCGSSAARAAAVLGHSFTSIFHMLHSAKLLPVSSQWVAKALSSPTMLLMVGCYTLPQSFDAAALVDSPLRLLGSAVGLPSSFPVL